MPSSVLCVQSFLLFIILDPKLEVFYGSSTTTAVKHIKVEGRSLNTKTHLLWVKVACETPIYSCRLNSILCSLSRLDFFSRFVRDKIQYQPQIAGYS